MARFVLCDRCGDVTKTSDLKEVKFGVRGTTLYVYDVCKKCYDELQEFMKPKEEEHNG